MAKVAFNKLNLQTDNSVVEINFNEQIIEVKKYLPIKDKITIISNVINDARDEVNKFYNPVKLDVYLVLEILYNYTNINFTQKLKENPQELYDKVISSGLFQQVYDVMGLDEYHYLSSYIHETVQAIYKYENSAMGILDIITEDYKDLDLNASAIQEKLADENNLSLLKNVLTKLG